jgi:hypothetical protein
LRYSVSGNVATEAEQYAYLVEPAHGTPIGDGSSLSELVALPDGQLLAMERSDAAGETLVRVFLVSTDGATDVSQGALGSGLIGQTYTPVSKRLLFSDASLGKFEGIALGPTLPGGELALLGVEDASGTTAVIRSFVLAGDFSADPCAGLGGDADADGVCGSTDNCPALANADQADADGDLIGDACDACAADPANDADADGVCGNVDNCPALANADQADGDGDLVGDVCDNCTAVSNPRVAADFVATNPWATLTGGQRDDDRDGYGNRCDGKFPGVAGTLVGAGDLAQFRASNGKNRTGDTCGTAGTRPCAIFDLDETGTVIGAGDLARFRQLNGKAAGPKCATCPLVCEAGASGSCQ